MKYRCYNTNSPSYPHYGERGITICDEWLTYPHTFVEYVETHLGECPQGYSLDRIDNDGNYEPGNIQWADRQQQNINKRNNVIHNRPVGVTGYKWVNKRSTGYVGQYVYQQKKYYVGHYNTAEEAYQSVITYRIAQGHPVTTTEIVI